MIVLTPRGERFPDWLRLRRKTEFERVFQGGRKCVRPFLVVHAAARELNPVTGALQPTRMGMAVSRKVGNAVVRNRIRRRLRELFRRLHVELAPGTDLVVTARSAAAEATYQQLSTDLRTCLEQIGILGAVLPDSSSRDRGSSGAS